MIRRLVAALMTLSFVGSAHAEEKRASPDYDGRGEDPTTAGDVLIWVPRVLVSPIYLVTEFLVRRPLGWLVTTAEREEVPAKIIEIFTFDDGNAGFAPTFLFDFGLEVGARASAGLYFFWDDLFAKDHEMRFRGAFGGNDWIELDLTNSYEFADEHEVYLALDLHRRADGVFGGIGPDHPDDAVGRYGFEMWAATIGTELEIGQRSWFLTGLELRDTTYFRGVCCGDDERSIQERVAQGYYPIPDGYSDHHLQLMPRVELALDSRHTRPASETGARVSLGAEYGHALDENSASYFRTELEVGGFVDVFEHRTFGLRLYTSLTEPVGDDGTLSFDDLSKLGGQRPMRAYVDGELRGRSALVGILEYRWPIWVWLDGNVFAELGNVFGPGYDDLSGDNLRLSFGLGIRPADREDHPFELLFAFGSDPGIHDITNFRVVFGTTSGF